MAQMREFLRLADAKEDTNAGLKEWVGQLREICCDIEGVLDKYMLRFGGGGGANGLKGCMKKAYASVKNLKARHQIASEIQAIKQRLDSVSASQKRYQDLYAAIDQGSSSTVPTNNELYDGRGDALFLDDTDVVGIEGPKKKLLEWIWSMDDGLEVMSVVGMGGLGKTTLVKKVYDEEDVKKYFNRHVWIAVSDYKGVKDMLASLIKKLVGEFNESPPPEELGSISVDEMRSFIFQFLHGGKYIIVLDDVWDMSTWEIIKFALPKRGTHGCIIITTRNISIANASCCETDHVYELEPLSEEESRELFYKKAFPRSSCPPEYLTEFAENILMKCGGLPLAIVVIGGLLATKKDNIEEWRKINSSISDELNEGGNLKRLGKLFSLSYNDLPYYLKYCFLYLSIYPGSDLLYRGQIIKYWMAEVCVIEMR